MFDKVKDSIKRNKYIMYLNYIGIGTEEIFENIRTNVEENRYALEEIFSNRSYQMLSPNIVLEDITFSEVNKYLYDNYNKSVVFEEHTKLDLKTLIATNNSMIERPSTKRPSESEEGIKTELEFEDSFVRIAKFENELKGDGFGRKRQTLIFEGLSISNEENPFVQFLPSFLIWKNAFYYGESFIIGFIKNFNSIESDNVLWLQQEFIDRLELKLDNFNNGLRALNDNNEVVLEFRNWRDDLIGNGASFVGQDSNIAKLEGCDLILREDYFIKLKELLGDIEFYSYKMEF